MRAALRSFPTLLRVGFADAVAYRAEFLIWILSTNMPLVMLALWSAVAREHPIGGWGQGKFAAYFLAALVVRLLTGCWAVWTMNYELRQGTLSFRLLRPVHPLLHYLAENVAAIPMRGLFALPVAAASLWILGSGELASDPWSYAIFLAAVLGAFAINFVSMTIVGCLGFFVESSLAIFQVWFGVYLLLSGYLIPLDFFPGWLREASAVLPFRFMLSFPVEVLLGRVSGGAALAWLGYQWALVAAMLALLVITWRAGLRRYSAYGG